MTCKTQPMYVVVNKTYKTPDRCCGGASKTSKTHVGSVRTTYKSSLLSSWICEKDLMAPDCFVN